jgi:phosphoribosylanthranilate isomerase
MKALKIKVCGMKQKGNIEQLVSLNPDYIGFIFYPQSKRYVGEQIAEDVLKIIPSNIQKVGVFVDEPFRTLQKKYRLNKLDVLQLHGNESPGYCLKLKKRGIPVIKAFLITEDFDFGCIKPYESCCDYFLFDTAGLTVGGTGIKFNWELINHYKGSKPFFLSGGIAPSDYHSIKKILHPELFAADINSGFELIPGFKDIAKVSTFIKNLRGQQLSSKGQQEIISKFVIRNS